MRDTVLARTRMSPALRAFLRTMSTSWVTSIGDTCSVVYLQTPALFSIAP